MLGGKVNEERFFGCNAECQLNLSESNISLINERKKIMKYINEIEDFRCKL